MRFQLIAISIAMLATASVAGTRVARDSASGDEVRIYDSPCVHAGTLARIPEQFRPMFNKAEATVEGKRFYGCWRDAGNAVYLIYEDGDQGIVPNDELREVPSI